MSGRISYYGGIVKDGLILYLDAGKKDSYPRSGTNWLDLSGFNNNGTLFNNPTFNEDNGGNIIFDGINDYINLPSNFWKHDTNLPFTINLWFRSSQTTGGPLFVQQSNITVNVGSSYVPVIYLANNGNIRTECFWTGSALRFILSTGTYNDNNWHNVVVTYSDSIQKLYINGDFINSLGPFPQVGYSATYYYFLGAGKSERNGSGTNYFIGDIGIFSFYNKALTVSEVLQNYNATKSRFGL